MAITRRDFLTSVGVAAGSVAAGDIAAGRVAQQEGGRAEVGGELKYVNAVREEHPFTSGTSARKRPHIFFITMDMVSPNFYLPSRSLYREVHLPTLRSITSEGVDFQNAFCTVPVCSPSRSSYLTGRYPYVLGLHGGPPDGIATRLRATDVIFPQYLKAAGYTTKHAGKCHVGAALFLDAFGENDNPWDSASSPFREDEIYLADLRRLGIKQQRYSREIVFLEPDRKTARVSVGGWIEQANGKPFPLEGQYTYCLIQRAIGKIESALEDVYTRDRPLYLQLDIFDPHHPLSIPEGFQKREKALRAAITLPGTYEKVRRMNWAPVPTQPEIYDHYRRDWGLYNPEMLRDYLVAYALQMEIVDRSLAELVQFLKRRGLYDESVIIVTSDHGEMSGRWAIIDKGAYLYPEVVRVPLTIRMPPSWGVKPHSVEAPVSLLDIAPTVLSLASVEPEARLDGRSLLPLIEGSEAPSDRNLLFMAIWLMGVNFAIGTQMWKPSGQHFLYSFNMSSGVDELYDLSSDDAENLAQRPEYKSTRHEMINRLGKLVKHDPRWRGDWNSFRLDRYLEFNEMLRRSHG